MKLIARVIRLCTVAAAVSGPADGAAETQVRSPLPVIRADATRPQAAMEARLVRLEQWLKAVMHHEPGSTDDDAELVRSWSNADLRSLWIDSNVVVQVIRDPKANNFMLRSEGQRTAQPVRYSSSEFRRIRLLACAAGGNLGLGSADDPVCKEAAAAGVLDDDLRRLATLARMSKAHGDDNYILRRGALLHADIAMLMPAGTEPIAPQSAEGPQRFRMSVSDGLSLDLAQVATHWELARMLLDYVKPRGSDRIAPGRDDMVRAWYRATAAWMQHREDYETEHLDRARAIFPSDPVLLFLSGCLAETYAAPHVQSAMRSAVLPPGIMFSVASDRSEWTQAEAFFRRALAVDPNQAETRLRLGHVLLSLEKTADAAKELREALAAMTDPLLRYYGSLFLGAAEEALGQSDAALEAYTGAAALYPRAQSPHIALSALARRRGDRATALLEIQTVFDLGLDELDRDDPWWTYYVAQARNANELLEDLWKPFRSTEPQ